MKTNFFNRKTIKKAIQGFVFIILFFPIVEPMSRMGIWFMKKELYKRLNEAVKAKNDDAVLRICAAFLKSHAERNKWKSKISKKWFLKIMQKEELKMYNYAIRENQITFAYFRTLIDVFLTYNIIGSGTVNKNGSTTIKVG